MQYNDIPKHTCFSLAHFMIIFNNKGDRKWRIFRHKISSGIFFNSDEDVLGRNSKKSSWANNTDYPLLSNLKHLSDEHKVEDGSFHLKLCYWGANLGELSGKCNEWRQKWNPVTSTTGGDFKAIELTWSEGFGGLCKLEGSKAERSMIGSCSNNDRFLVGQKGNSNSNDLSVSVMNARKKRTTDPQDIGVDDMRLYVKFSVTNCGVYTSEKDNNLPFKFDYSTFFFEGEEHSNFIYNRRLGGGFTK